MRLFEDPVARLLVLGVAGDQLVEGRLRVEHHRPELALHLDALLPRTAPGRPASPRCRAPRGRASRRAASPGRSSARRPSARAPPSRSRSPPRSSSCRRRRSRRRCRCPCPRGSRRRPASAQLPGQACGRASTPSSGSKRKGRVLTGASTRRRRRASWARWRAGAAVLGDGGARRRPTPSPSSSRASSASRSASSLEKRSRVEAVHVDAVDGDADLVAQVVLQRRGLVDRHLLGQGDDRRAGVLLVGDQAVELLRLRVDRPDPGDRGEGARRLQEADPVAGRRRVDDHQVVLAAALDLAVELGQLPDLADRDQLLEARAWRRRGR